MQKVKRSLLQKGESNISSITSIEIQSSDGKLKLVDLLSDDGCLYGMCWFVVNETSDFDNTDILYEGLLDLKNKEKNTSAYKLLKKYVKDGGVVFKDCKQELRVMFNDAVKLGMFSSVPKSVKIEQDEF